MRLYNHAKLCGLRLTDTENKEPEKKAKNKTTIFLYSVLKIEPLAIGCSAVQLTALHGGESCAPFHCTAAFEIKDAKNEK